jgi:hypothetical protein
MAKLLSAMMTPFMKKRGEVCGKDLDDLKTSIESS